MLDRLKANRRWLALSALVALNAVLITLVFAQHATQAVPGAVVPGEVVSASATAPVTSATPRRPAGDSSSTDPNQSAPPTREPSPVQSSSPGPSASPSTGAPRRLLTANSAKIAWRAVEGDCDRQSPVEVTTDGGRTWRTTETGIYGIARLQAYGETAVFAVGADRDCEPTYAWITSPKASWRTDQSVMWDVWYRYPEGRDRIHAPGGRSFRPCGGDIVTLAGLGSDRAAVLCEDGRIRTMTRGQGWQTVLSDSGGTAITTDKDRFLVVRVRSDCAGIVLQHIDAAEAEPRDHGVCRMLSVDRDGPVAAAGVGDVTWMWAGHDTVVS